MEGFEEHKKEANLEKQVEEKLQNAQAEAATAVFVEEQLSKLVELERRYLARQISNTDKYKLSQPLMRRLVAGSARFDTIGEYSLALRKLHETKWL